MSCPWLMVSMLRTRNHRARRLTFSGAALRSWRLVIRGRLSSKNTSLQSFQDNDEYEWRAFSCRKCCMAAGTSSFAIDSSW